VAFLEAPKRCPVATILKYGNGQHLFEDIDYAPQLKLASVTEFSNGAVILILILTPCR
jgi:hypothetical protein